jgi:hypothetical protein
VIAAALAHAVLLAAVALLLAGCTSADGDGSGPTGDGAGDGQGQSGDGDSGGDPKEGLATSDTIPDDLDVRLQRRITSPLPDGVVVRFQHFNRGPDPRVNYWWELSSSGEVHLARHSPDTSDPDTPFDTPLPDDPVAVLDEAAIEEVRAALDASGFATQPSYQLLAGVEDGAFNVVTARLPGGEVREVIYEGASPPPVDTLVALTERIWEESS